MLYNNLVFSHFSILAALLWVGGALAMGLFFGAPRVQNHLPLRAAYLADIGIALLTSLLLTYIRKRKPALLWLTTPITLAECSMIVALLMISTHLELADGGIKRIEVLMMLLFFMVLLCRYPIWLTVGLQTAFSAAFILQLCLERPLIRNFPPCLTNLIATYCISTGASLLYAASRVRGFIDRKNLEALVSVDFLTNVHNRRGFDYMLQLSWKEAKNANSIFSFFMIDIDDFKQYNDDYGHQEGDKCLTAVAKAIGDPIRKGDVVARYGGEEFAVILRDTPREAAERVARRMLDEMSRQNLPRPVTFSIGGISCRPAESAYSPEGLIRRADEALYLAKAQGKGRAVFHADSL